MSYMSTSQFSVQQSQNNKNTNNSVFIYKSLDIDSSYRNRNQYPNPNSFNISTKFNSINNVDPIINSIKYTGSLSRLPGELQIQAGSTSTEIILDPFDTDRDNFYVSNFLEISGEFRKIISYDAINQTAIVETPFTNPPVLGDIYYTRKSIPFFTGTVDTVISQNRFTLDVTGSSINNQYQNSFLTFISGSNIDKTAKIQEYLGSTKTVVLSNSMPNPILPGDLIELGAFTRDNSSSLLYVGNTNKSIFEIELNWISIPNQLLKVGYGGRISNYPYIYVKLYNDGNNLSSQVLYSNNPNSISVLFKVPINEFYGEPDFITLKDAKSVQTISLNVEQDLRFECTLPNGEIIEFAKNDSLSPNSPNPFLQINALFSLRKINEQL